MVGSGEGAEISAQAIRFFLGEECLDLAMSTLPDRGGAGEDGAAFCSEDQAAAAAVFWIHGNFEQAIAFEGLKGRGQGGAIHGQQRGDGSHGGRLGAIQRGKQGELTVGEANGTECLVEAAGQGAGGALDMETEAAVANQKRGAIGGLQLT